MHKLHQKFYLSIYIYNINILIYFHIFIRQNKNSSKCKQKLRKKKKKMFSQHRIRLLRSQKSTNQTVLPRPWIEEYAGRVLAIPANAPRQRVACARSAKSQNRPNVSKSRRQDQGQVRETATPTHLILSETISVFELAFAWGCVGLPADGGLLDPLDDKLSALPLQSGVLATPVEPTAAWARALLRRLLSWSSDTLALGVQSKSFFRCPRPHKQPQAL